MRFKQQKDGNFLDKKSGLIWKKRVEPGIFTFDEAMNTAWPDGWRVPTVLEMLLIMSKKRHQGKFTKLPNSPFLGCWTNLSDNRKAWHADFQYGNIFICEKNSKLRVRLVK